MRPRIIGEGYNGIQFKAEPLSLDQGLAVFSNAISSPQDRIHAIRAALTNEWERNNFNGIHAPIHEAVKNFPDGTANTVIRRIEENHAKSLDADNGLQR